MLTIALGGMSAVSFAQATNTENIVTDVKKPSRFHLGLNVDPIALVKSSNSFFPALFIERGSNWSSTRFDYLGAGMFVHYDISAHIGLVSGVDLKKVSVKEGAGSYNISVPIGVRFGYLQQNKYLVLGGGIDKPVYYADKKTYTTYDLGWFSNRPNPLMMYISVGAVYKIFSLKAQYYFTDFYNANFRIPDEIEYSSLAPNFFEPNDIAPNTYPYASRYSSLPLIISAGVTVPFSKMNAQGMKTLLK